MVIRNTTDSTIFVLPEYHQRQGFIIIVLRAIGTTRTFKLPMRPSALMAMIVIHIASLHLQIQFRFFGLQAFPFGIVAVKPAYFHGSYFLIAAAAAAGSTGEAIQRRIAASN